MSKLVVVSNRVTHASSSTVSGGLAVGVVDALKSSGGVWLGWNGSVVNDHAQADLNCTPQNGIDYCTFPLSQHDYDRFYRGFSNATLWPTFHYRADISRYQRNDYEGYLNVNRDFARRLAALLGPDDVIWVHDYHLLALGKYCRELGIENRIGFFLHIPFPQPEVFRTLPPHRELAEAMCTYDLLGFQTETDERAFVDYCVRHLQARRTDHILSVQNRRLHTGTYPIGIDTGSVAEMANAKRSRHVATLKSGLVDRKLIISVDRLDYSKGLVERFNAFGQLLEHTPHHRGSVSFVQIAPPSRTDVLGYRELRRELERTAGRINGKWGELAWTPLQYMNRSYDRSVLMPLLRASQIGFVTPLRDGMNLIAKEYVAAQPGDNPGVLVLSEFAGAAQEMAEGAILVNPHDTEGMARALDRALCMPLTERITRYESMMQRLRANDLSAWRDRFLSDLRDV